MDDFTTDLSKVLRYNAEERASFEAAIDKNPLESTNHLVYADWLQEQGEHEEAEFRRAMGEWHRNGTEEVDGYTRRKCRITGPSPNYNNTVHVREADLPSFVNRFSVEDIPRSPHPTPFREHTPETAYNSGSGTFSWDTYRNFEKAMMPIFTTHYRTSSAS